MSACFGIQKIHKLVMPGSQFVSSGEALAEIWWTAEVQRSTLTGGTKHGQVLWSWKGLEQALKIDELFHPFQPQPNTPRKQVWNQHENIRGQKSILRILRNPVWTWNRMWDTHRVLANAMPVIHKIANSQLFMTCEIGWNREVFDAVFKTSEALLSVISVMVVESIQDHQLPCASRVARATRHQYHLSSMVQVDQMAGSGCNCGMQIAQWFPIKRASCLRKWICLIHVSSPWYMFSDFKTSSKRFSGCCLNEAMQLPDIGQQRSLTSLPFVTAEGQFHIPISLQRSTSPTYNNMSTWNQTMSNLNRCTMYNIRLLDYSKFTYIYIYI